MRGRRGAGVLLREPGLAARSQPQTHPWGCSVQGRAKNLWGWSGGEGPGGLSLHPSLLNCRAGGAGQRWGAPSVVAWHMSTAALL